MPGLNTQDIPITDKQLTTGLWHELRNMQGHILRSHGRDRSVHIFLRFRDTDKADRDKAKKWIAKIADKCITSAQKQLDEAKEYNKGRGRPGDLFCCFFLSADGYRALGIPEANLPSDEAFRQGMGKRAILNDPPKQQWQVHHRGDIHAMLLLADDDEQALKTEEQIRTLEIREIGEICAIEWGRVMRHPQTRRTYEHFGYVDGRSQLLFFERDLEDDKDDIDRSHSEAGPNLVLVPDPNGDPEKQGYPAYGSYLVFRKLEQKVRAFQDHLDELANTLGLQGHDRQRVEALVMGRFRDGTPVMLQGTPGQNDPVSNNFDFTNDPQGLRCPFQAHIRRMNPRGERDQSFQNILATGLQKLSRITGPERDRLKDDLAATLGRVLGEEPAERDRIRRDLALDELAGVKKSAERYRRIQSTLTATHNKQYKERDHRIARRAVPYGTRRKEPYDTQSRDDLPQDGVGLLFMCYQNSIGQQFEFLQGNWANKEDFPEQATGLDAIIGLSKDCHTATGHNWPLRWNARQEGPNSLRFQSFVTLKGGEYFFAPSIPFLRNITTIGD